MPRGTTASFLANLAQAATRPAKRSIESPCGSFPDRPDIFTAQRGQDKFVLQHLVTQCRGGTYVEFGARDGVQHSNTHFFESQLHWTGLLFEADPPEVMQLRSNRPRATIYEGAVCPAGMQNVSILSSRVPGFSGFASSFEPSRRKTVTRKLVRPCYQLANELRANNISRVDYMTIDTEGSEAMLVEDFPWGDFDVRVVQIEQLEEKRFSSHRGHRERIQDHLAKFGYRLYKTHIVKRNDTYDLIFKRDPGAGIPTSRLVGYATSRMQDMQDMKPAIKTLVACMSATKPTHELAINSLLKQAVKFDRIIVANYTQGARRNISTSPSLFISTMNVVIPVTCETDWGPGSKLLCCLQHLRKFADHGTYITLLDDDMEYRPYATQDILAKLAEAPDAAVGFWSFKSANLTVLPGVDTITTRITNFDGILPWYVDLQQQHPWLRYHDDLWINLWLAIKNVTRIRLPLRGYAKNKELIYRGLCKDRRNGLCDGLVTKKPNETYWTRARLLRTFRQKMPLLYPDVMRNDGPS